MIHIDDLITLCLLGEAESHEEEELNLWIAESPENKKYYEDFKAVWEASLFIGQNSTIDENQSWKRFQKRIEPAKTIWFKPWMAAASLLLVLSLGWIYFSDKNTAPEHFAYQTTDTAQTFNLPDSSVVVLNKNSALTFIQSKDIRKAELLGEAFFDVKPDKSRPFKIDINQVQVQVLGTSFNIKGYDGQTEVVVETGLVKVSKGETEMQLKANETVVVSEKNVTLEKETVKNEYYNFYRTGKLVFTNTPLKEVTKVLSDAYGIEIEIRNEKLEKLPISTVFDNQSIESVLQIIAETLPVRIEKQNNRILLK